MAKHTDTCPVCKSSFTNYMVQPLKYCSVSCQLASPIIDDFIEQVYVGEARLAKSVRVKENK